MPAANIGETLIICVTSKEDPGEDKEEKEEEEEEDKEDPGGIFAATTPDTRPPQRPLGQISAPHKLGGGPP